MSLYYRSEKKYQICANISTYMRAYIYFSLKKKYCRLSHWTDQVSRGRREGRGGEWSFCERARRIHSSTGVPSHVCTQQGRVNAQQGRCPLNLRGFLNANANRSPSIRTSIGHWWWSVHYSSRYRSRPKQTHTTIDSRLSWKSGDSLARISNGEKDSWTRTLISLSHHRGHRDQMGISSFSSELRVFLFPFLIFLLSFPSFLPIARDQIADRLLRSPGALVPRT